MPDNTLFERPYILYAFVEPIVYSGQNNQLIEIIVVLFYVYTQIKTMNRTKKNKIKLLSLNLKIFQYIKYRFSIKI